MLINEDILNALEDFLECFSDGLLLDDIGPHLTCTETEALALLLIACELPDSAAALRIGHSLEDDEGDMPEHLELKKKYEKEDDDAEEGSQNN